MMKKTIGGLFIIVVVFAISYLHVYGQVYKPALDAVLVESRTALVIGNGDYRNSPLPNPVNDARVISQLLEKLGFEVIKGENLSQNEMKYKIFEFGKKLEQKGGTGLFYFAGHGVQVNGKNYLIPVGATIKHDKHVEIEGIDVDRVLAEIENARNRMNIVILDACRDNPFARSFRSSAQGLASIDAPTGTLIAYATAPGKTAADGEGNNGLYTGELIRWMQTPGLKIEDVFKRVRSSVREKSDNQQIPWESSSLEGDFYFNISSAFPQTQAPQIATIDVPEYKPHLTEPSIKDEQTETPPRIIKSPNQAELLRNQGFYFYQSKQYDKAIETLSKAIELGPGDHYAYFYRGSCYLELKDYEKAVNDFDTAIELNPEYSFTYISKGVAHTELKDYETAIKSFGRAIELNSKDHTAYFNRGITFIYSKQYEAALVDFDEVIKLKPDRLDAKKHAEYLRKMLNK